MMKLSILSTLALLALILPSIALHWKDPPQQAGEVLDRLHHNVAVGECWNHDGNQDAEVIEKATSDCCEPIIQWFDTESKRCRVSQLSYRPLC